MAEASPDHDGRPTVLTYFPRFLNPEMLHVYRQVAGLRAYSCWVATKRRSHEDRFPFARITILDRSPLRGFARAWHKLRGARHVPMPRNEQRQLAALCASLQPELIHLYLGTVAATVLPWLESEHVAKIVSFHGGDTSDALADDDLARIVATSDLLLCRSESLRAVLLGRGVPADKIRLNPTGIPIPADAPPHEPPTVTVDRPLRVLQACRFNAKKALDVSIRAVRQLRDAGVPTTLTLAGDGPEREALQALAAQLDLIEAIAWPGFVDQAELSALLRSHDLFVHPSRTTASKDREGIPNSMLEAMAAGLPIVATAHSGIPEAVTHEQHGLLIDEADPARLAEALRRLAEDATLYASLANAGRQRVIDNFSIDACITTLEHHYDEARKRASTRASANQCKRSSPLC